MYSWVSMVQGKYRCGEHEFPIINKKRVGSNLWSDIKVVWEKVVANCDLIDGARRWNLSSDGRFSTKSTCLLVCC